MEHQGRVKDRARAGQTAGAVEDLLLGEHMGMAGSKRVKVVIGDEGRGDAGGRVFQGKALGG